MKYLSIVLVLFLSACGESNPLLNQDADKSVQQLMQASSRAALINHFPERDSADYYRQCLLGRQSASFCQTLCQSMVKALQGEGLKVTANQLKDKRLTDKIGAMLERQSYLME